jgi:hypothetical protein
MRFEESFWFGPKPTIIVMKMPSSIDYWWWFSIHVDLPKLCWLMGHFHCRKDAIVLNATVVPQLSARFHNLFCWLMGHSHRRKDAIVLNDTVKMRSYLTTLFFHRPPPSITYWPNFRTIAKSKLYKELHKRSLEHYCWKLSGIPKRGSFLLTLHKVPSVKYDACLPKPLWQLFLILLNMCNHLSTKRRHRAPAALVPEF